jgi:hypothetical protein
MQLHGSFGCWEMYVDLNIRWQFFSISNRPSHVYLGIKMRKSNSCLNIVDKMEDYTQILWQTILKCTEDGRSRSSSPGENDGTNSFQYWEEWDGNRCHASMPIRGNYFWYLPNDTFIVQITTITEIYLLFWPSKSAAHVALLIPGDQMDELIYKVKHRNVRLALRDWIGAEFLGKGKYERENSQGHHWMLEHIFDTLYDVRSLSLDPGTACQSRATAQRSLTNFETKYCPIEFSQHDVGQISRSSRRLTQFRIIQTSIHQNISFRSWKGRSSWLYKGHFSYVTLRPQGCISENSERQKLFSSLIGRPMDNHKQIFEMLQKSGCARVAQWFRVSGFVFPGKQQQW